MQGHSDTVAVNTGMERVMGIEPTFEAWEAPVLPLNYTRIVLGCHYSTVGLFAESPPDGRGMVLARVEELIKIKVPGILLFNS